MTTGTPASSSRRGTPGWVPWVATPLIAIMLGVALDAVDQGAPDRLGGPAARYVPADGQRTVARDLLGAETVTEHTRSVGIEGAFSAPMLVAAVASRLGQEELSRAQWWRASRVSGAGERSADLYRLSSAGITQVASWGGEIGFVFEPEVMILPASVSPGDTWSGSGSALADGVLTYTAEAVATAVTQPPIGADGREIPLTGGCIGIESTLRIANAEDDLATTLVESSVWCAGRGPVWSTGTVDDQPIGQTEVPPDALMAADSPPPAASWDSASPAPTRLGSPRSLPLTIGDPFFGPTVENGQFAVIPASTLDGRLVTANDRGDDLQVWRLEGDQAALDWFGHPGGTIVAVGTADDLVLASTSRRVVHAYDSTGRRLWSWIADELVLAPPLGVGVEGVLVVARSGTVSILDAATGQPRWSTSLGADARARPAVADGLVLVADERDRLTALDVETGRVVWQQEPGAVELMSADADSAAVAVMLESGELGVHDLGDGRVRFTVPYRGVAEGLAIGSGQVVAVTDERTAALDADDGTEQWQAPGGSALVGEGALVAIVGPSTIELRSARDGVLVDDSAIEAGLVSSSRRALAVGPAIVLLDSDGVLQRWEPR